MTTGLLLLIAGVTLTASIGAAFRRPGIGLAVTVTGAVVGAVVALQVLVGGDNHGAGPDPDAEAAYVAPTATITADARQTGNGGNVVVWSDYYTNFQGQISAQGGPSGGNGVTVAVSRRRTRTRLGSRLAANSCARAASRAPTITSSAVVRTSPATSSRPKAPLPPTTRTVFATRYSCRSRAASPGVGVRQVSLRPNQR